MSVFLCGKICTLRTWVCRVRAVAIARSQLYVLGPDPVSLRRTTSFASNCKFFFVFLLTGMNFRCASHTRTIFCNFRSFSGRAGPSANVSLHTTPRNDLSPLTPGPRLSDLRTRSIFLWQMSPRMTPKRLYRFYSSSQEAVPPMKDPSRDDLYYHVLLPPTPISSSLPAFGLSFLPIPPPSADSCAVIGWLPAASEGEGQEAGLNDFKENRTFSSLSTLTCCVINYIS